jgi:hypothetical protein
MRSGGGEAERAGLAGECEEEMATGYESLGDCVVCHVLVLHPLFFP